MTKGYKGETCTEAIRASIKTAEILTAYDLFNRIRESGTWTDDTIWQHLIAHVVNHPAARHHYAGFEPFLYLHEDGRYELFDPAIHPVVRFHAPASEGLEAAHNQTDSQTELELEFPESEEETDLDIEKS